MDKIALVTGSSRGIGRAVARRLAAEGYAVCVNYRERQDCAMSLVAEISAAGGRAMAVQADAAIDIGDTLVGMHIRPVAVPLRLDVNHVGHANLVMAYSRLPYIGGSRAVYE